jgi:hypothetical protein
VVAWLPKISCASGTFPEPKNKNRFNYEIQIS